jgi:hypothetical protein
MVRHHCGYARKAIYSSIPALTYTTWIRGMDTLVDIISRCRAVHAPHLLFAGSKRTRAYQPAHPGGIGSGEGNGDQARLAQVSGLLAA